MEAGKCKGWWLEPLSGVGFHNRSGDDEEYEVNFVVIFRELDLFFRVDQEYQILSMKQIAKEYLHIIGIIVFKIYLAFVFFVSHPLVSMFILRESAKLRTVAPTRLTHN